MDCLEHNKLSMKWSCHPILFSLEQMLSSLHAFVSSNWNSFPPHQSAKIFYIKCHLLQEVFPG